MAERLERGSAVVRRDDQLWLWCPGCEDLHAVNVAGDRQPIWGWDGDLNRPTISPSILARHRFQTKPGETRDVVCHSFVRDGVWEFLPDSTHQFAGGSIAMTDVEPQWPGWLGGPDD